MIEEYEIQREEVVEGENEDEKKSDKVVDSDGTSGTNVEGMGGPRKKLGGCNVSTRVEDLRAPWQQLGSFVAGEGVKLEKEVLKRVLNRSKNLVLWPLTKKDYHHWGYSSVMSRKKKRENLK